MTTTEHTLSTSTVDSSVEVTCSCGYRAVTVAHWTDLIVSQHTAHPVAHLDPRLVIGG